MKLYVDFFAVIPSLHGSKYHGGGNYARNIIYEIIQKRNEIDIVILCPEWYNPTEKNEPIFYNNKQIVWKQLKQLSDSFIFEEKSILWSPILSKLKDFKILTAIKKKRPDMKVCATVHDLRTLNFVWDKTEKYYFCGVKRVFFPIYKFLFEGLMIHLIKRPVIKKCLTVLDEVYTVSNFAMQDIIRLSPNTKVSWYYQSSLFNCTKKNSQQENGKYLLFVSGGRRLKNLGHAMIGFSYFKLQHPESDLKLVIVGISEQTYKNLCSIPNVSREVMKSSVICHEYVSNEELQELYCNCHFALYTSKMEGFGLPVIEAALFGKTSIVSNVTSIPEVMGPAVRYVYPQDDCAIARELEYLCNDSNLHKYEKRIKEAMHIIDQRMKFEQDSFIEDLLEYNLLPSNTKWNFI